jgi:hypothetical protein
MLQMLCLMLNIAAPLFYYRLLQVTFKFAFERKLFFVFRVIITEVFAYPFPMLAPVYAELPFVLFHVLAAICANFHFIDSIVGLTVKLAAFLTWIKRLIFVLIVLSFRLFDMALNAGFDCHRSNLSTAFRNF